jgi:molybdopterin synthase catalytic subunit
VRVKKLERARVCGKGEISIQSLLDLIRSNERFEEVGAVSCFLGFVRGVTLKNEKVERLEYEAYKEEAEKAFFEIIEDVKKRPGIVDVVIHHVVDQLQVGDLVLAVIVAGKSRKDVFPALVETVERVKREAPIWKKETLATGESYWVGEKQAFKE